MKKILLFLLGILIVACSESSDSDDNSLNNLASIVGVWKFDRITEVCSSGSEVFNLSVCDQKSRLIFVNNVELITIHYYDSIGCSEPSESIGTYTIDNNTLTMFFIEDPGGGDDIEIWTINKLTSAQLVLETSGRESVACDYYDESSGTWVEDGTWLSDIYEFIRVE